MQGAQVQSLVTEPDPTRCNSERPHAAMEIEDAATKTQGNQIKLLF